MELYLNNEKIEVTETQALLDLIKGNSETFTIKCTKENQNLKFFITDVGCSFSIGFAQYISKEHYKLVNIIGKIHYWKNEEFSKTTEQLLKDYKETLG